MDATLTFEQYPVWYIGFCLLAGLIYALALYFKDTSFREATTRQRWALLPLSILRFLTVSAITFLLLTPLIKSRFIEVVKPQILFVQDNSQSMMKGFENVDSAMYIKKVNAFLDGLKEDYDIRTYNFGEQLEEGLEFTFDEKTTNITQPIEDIYNKYNNQNVGAVVLATDGIYNQGSNPIYTNIALEAPLFAIALGDTTPQRDVVLERVLHNKIAYLGDKFTIRVDVSAQNSKGATTVLKIFKGAKNKNKVHTKSIKIDKENFVKGYDVVLKADKPGIQQYNIILTEIKDEVTTHNNRQEMFIDVVDSRQKILMLAASPHPDIAAIKHAMELNQNYEITVKMLATFDGSAKGYDLVVLHGIPAKGKDSQSFINQLKVNNIPSLFIVSTQTDVPALNQSQSVMYISNSNSSFNDVKAEPSGKTFNLFNIEPSVINSLSDLPPLSVPFGEYAASPTTQVLLKQKIGSVSTRHPLLVIEQATGYKSAVFAGEGLWRWRLYDYKTDGRHDATNELISKVIQYLSVKNDKRKFRVSMPKTLYYETEQISFDAELYNDSYELINGPEVNITIYNETGKEFPFAFSKTSTAYTLNAGFFPPGRYTYKARTAFNGKDFSATGKFSVLKIELETLQTSANHQSLHTLTERMGGDVFYINDMDSLPSQIRKKGNPAIQYASYKTKPLINLRWLFFFLLAFLAIEWFVRKFIGGY